jgi:hypothetical protein
VPLLAAEFRRSGLQWPAADTAVVDAYQIFVKREQRNLGAPLQAEAPPRQPAAWPGCALLHALLGTPSA